MVQDSVLKAKPTLAGYSGKQVVLGMRPESFEMSTALNSYDEKHTMSASVELVEQLGSEAYLHFHRGVPPVVTPDIAELLADEGADPSTLGDTTKFVARVNPDFAPRPGDDVKLVIDTTKLAFFDKETGMAIY